ncbi:hypothetical protein LCGC14_2894150, partial [marine sediment metagenome]
PAPATFQLEPNRNQSYGAAILVYGIKT